MRLANPRHLGLAIRERRRVLGLTQAQLAKRAGVSRRFLSDLEAGKPTAELGLTLQTMSELGLVIDVILDRPAPGQVDLDEHLRRYRRQPPQETTQP